MSAEPGTVGARQAAIAVALGAALWVALLLPRLDDSFWLDETAVCWLTAGGWAELFERWERWPYQSLAHAALALAWSKVWGGSELALRLLSTCAMGITLVSFSRLARELLPVHARASALVALLGSAPVLLAAANHRPYALGFAALVTSWLALVRWDESGSARHAATWVAATALVPSFHLTLVVALAAQLPCLVRRLVALPPRERPGRLGWFALPLLLATPLLPSVAETWALGPLLSWPPPASWQRLLRFLVPLPVAVVVVGAIVLSRATATRADSGAAAFDRRLWWIALPMWLVPLGLPFLLSRATTLELFTPAYTSGAAPGFALVIGGVLAGGSTTRVASWAALVLAAAIPLTATSGGWNRIRADPWREALDALRPPAAGADDTVLVAMHFVEARFARFERELEPGGMLLSPLAAYPITARAVGVSTRLNPESEARLALVWERERALLRGRLFLLQPIRSAPLRWLGREHADWGVRPMGSWGELALFEITPPASGSIPSGS